jgi:hypothetical protein
MLKRENMVLHIDRNIAQMMEIEMLRKEGMCIFPYTVDFLTKPLSVKLNKLSPCIIQVHWLITKCLEL